jgi:CHASE2 domain-containing sensor protein
MTSHESRIFARSIGIGAIVTLLVVLISMLGGLETLENFLYDRRANDCQFMAPPPTKQLVHLDIDDNSLAAIGRWPWPRQTLAQILDEVRAANPSAVGLDIFFSEPQTPRWVHNPDDTFTEVNDDEELAQTLKQIGTAVLAASFEPEPPQTQVTAESQAVDWFKKDLEISRDDFTRLMLSTPWKGMDSSAMDDLFIRARRVAMKQRIDAELDRGPANRDQLIARLFPHADPTVNSPLFHSLDDEYSVSLAAHGISRFGLAAPPLPLAPVHGMLNVLPTPNFTDAAAGIGFANYDIFDNATVRSVPLFIEFHNKLYPQMGLAVACTMLHADLHAAKFDEHSVSIPYPGGMIRIPTYVYHSKTLGIDVPLIAAVPWFGTDQWETMYDWPSHRSSAAHLSLARVWDICLTRQNIIKDNQTIDDAVSHLLDSSHPDDLGVDPDLAKKLLASKPAPEDSDARQKMAATALQALDDSGWLAQYQHTAEKDLAPVDRVQRDNLLAARDALIKSVADNRGLTAQLASLRHNLDSQISGKGVFIGFTASGNEDKVSTSLHLHVPGVVVHGVIANAVLTGRWWRVAPEWFTTILTLILGLTAAYIQGRFAPLKASFLALSLAIGYWLVNGLILFDWQRWIVGVAGPMIAIVLVWAVCTLFRVIIEGLERIRVSAEKDVLQEEMELARRVQFALIPAQPPEMPGINADGWTNPADETGGDCYDLWKLPDGRLGVLVADASGHGLAPAMIVSQVRTLVHVLSENESHPHDLLKRINARLALDLEPGRFVTAFLAFVRSDGQIQWASAGHGPMLWSPTGDGKMQELSSTGLPLGVQEDWLADAPRPPLQLEPTGRLIVLSDGIFEAHSPQKTLWGTEPVVEILHKANDAAAKELIESIRSAVHKWQKKVEPADDQTIVVIRRVPIAQETKTEPATDQSTPAQALAVEVEVSVPAVPLRKPKDDAVPIAGANE